MVADAVVVLSGEQTNPDEVAGEETAFQAEGRRGSGRDVARVARKHLGTRYVESPPQKCKAYRKEDCSCHTKVVFRRLGRSLPDNPPSQWKRGKRVKKANLRPGDVVRVRPGERVPAAGQQTPAARRPRVVMGSLPALAFEVVRTP